MVPETLVSLLHACSKNRLLHHGLSLHASAVKAGLESTFICNHILNMYAKCGRVGNAHQVFDEMLERNVVTWSALISGYDQCGKHLMSVELFSRMILEEQPNEFVYGSVLSSCASLMAPITGQQIHGHSLKLGYSSISFVCNSLISMYMKCGRSTDAESVFDNVSKLSMTAYNALITGFLENKHPEKGIKIFKTMCQNGLVPDRFTFMGVLGSCLDPFCYWRGLQLHCQTIKLKLDSMAIIGNIIISMYSKFGLIEESEKMFKSINEKDVISWNTMIAACSQCDDHAKALNVFREMEEENTQRPDDFTYSSVLTALAGLASIRHGKQVHALLIRTLSDKDTCVSNAVMNMYAKCGCIRYGWTVFNQMGRHNLVSWNTMIAGFANNGLGYRALEMFELMKDMGIKPDSITFVGLLSACNHSGLLTEGLDLYSSMDTIYGIVPDIDHFSCIIDLLGRLGRLSEAHKHMHKYQFGDDPVILGCLLSACRLHGDVVTGEKLAKRILSLQTTTSSPYILLSSLYASDGMWDSAAEARKMFKGSGLKKDPGHSLIDVDGFIQKFTLGEFSHPQIKEVVETLKSFEFSRG